MIHTILMIKVSKMSWLFVTCLLTVLLVACRPESMLDQALKQALDNRSQLEIVLDYYKQDSLKYKAACFLIGNMIGKGAILYVENKRDSSYIQKEPEPDLRKITAAYLIENIDIAFEVWKKYPWCKELSFDEFCRSILPYRLRQEPLDHWRRFYYYRYRVITDSLAAAGASMKEVVFFMNSHYGKKYIHDVDRIPGDFPLELIEKFGGGTCDHLALNAVQQMRAIGVPLNLDVLPYHGKVNGGHSYNSFTDEKGQFFFFSPYEREPERNKWIAPLVQRICYERQPEGEIKSNRWNAQLVHPQLANVTSQYYQSCSVTLTLPSQLSDSVVYLATYNRGEFKVVAQSRVKSGRALFPLVTCGLLYFQVAPKGNKLCPVGYPFVTNADSVCFITPVQKTVELNGLSLYDVKRVLKLGTEPYSLLYWEEGWKPLKTAVSKDSYTLDFGEVPVQSLYLLYGDIGMECMQRPFLFEKGKPIYY